LPPLSLFFCAQKSETMRPQWKPSRHKRLSKLVIASWFETLQGNAVAMFMICEIGVREDMNSVDKIF
jgi:hypothetical protein